MHEKAASAEGAKVQEIAWDAGRQGPGEAVEELGERGTEGGEGDDRRSPEGGSGERGWEQVEEAKRDVGLNTPVRERDETDQERDPGEDLRSLGVGEREGHRLGPCSDYDSSP